MVIVPSILDIPQGEENFCEESFQSGVSYKTLKNALNTVLLLGKAISYDRWVEWKPYLPRKVAVEEEMGINLNYTTSGAIVVDVVGESSSSVRRGKSSPY